MRYGLCSAILCTVVTAACAGDANTTPGYPQWRGPTGSGTSIDCDVQLVDSWDNARLMWASEQRNPLPSSWARSALNPRRLVGNGGFGPPIYHDGRVYVAAFEPNGPIAETLGARVRSSAPDICKRISADDVLYCLDARDGTLLWKASFPYGMNMAGHTHSGHYIPSIHKGRAYWVGTIGQLYCVDARTGKKLWHVPLDGGAKRAQEYRRHCLEQKQYPRGGRRAIEDACEEMEPEKVSMRNEIGLEGSRGWGWDSPVIAAGEVVVTNTPGRALVAFDAQTGERRWYRPNATSSTTAPAIWWHKGKAYVIGVGGKGISCTEADTGKQLWVSRLGGSGAYAGYTPPIEGDILVCLGADDEGETKRGPWAAFRLTLEGPKRLWRLRKPFRCTYESPVIYRGHLWTVLREPRRWTDEQWDWVQKQAPHSFTDKLRKDHGLRNMIAAVDLETGKVSGAVVTGQLGCSSIVGGDGRLIFMGGNSVQMITADPDNPKDLGRIYPGNLWSTTPVYAEGKLFVRGAEYLVNAWDLRADPPKKKPSTEKKPEPANSLIVIDLQCARIYEEDLRMAFQRGGSGETPQAEDLKLHLRTREGKIVQSYVTYGPAHNVPERVYPDLALKDNRLAGKVRIESLGRVYPLEMDLEMDGRTLTGIWEDPTHGKKMKGSVSGMAAPAATADGKVSLEIRREWCGGCTHSHQTYISFDMKDGKAVPDSATIRPRDGEKAYEIDIKSFEATLDGRELKGKYTVELTSHSYVRSGTYTVEWKTQITCNRPTGEYRSWRGESEITPKSAVNRGVWGKIDIARSAKVNPGDAIHEMVLSDALPNGKSLRVSVELRDGKAVYAKAASRRFTTAGHSVDFSKVELKDGRLVGPMEVIIRTDGFNPPHDVRTRYDLDLQVKGRELTGKFKGIYEVRDQRSGFAKGEVVAE